MSRLPVPIDRVNEYRLTLRSSRDGAVFCAERLGPDALLIRGYADGLADALAMLERIVDP